MAPSKILTLKTIIKISYTSWQLVHLSSNPALTIRKWLLNQKVFIFASSNCPEHSTLGDAKSSISLGLGSPLVSYSPLGYALLLCIETTTWVTFIR